MIRAHAIDKKSRRGRSPCSDTFARRRLVLFLYGADEVPESIPDVDPEVGFSRFNRIGDFHFIARHRDRFGPSGRQEMRHGARVIVFVDRVAGRIPYQPRLMEETETIQELADLIRVDPVTSPVLGCAAESAAEVRGSPSSDPSVRFVDKANALEVCVLLLIVDRVASPALSTVRGLQNRACLEIL